jgi:hypothetical protein
MKKILLSFMFVCVAYFANAQTCSVGYSPTGIYDDYSSTTEDGSLYFGTVPGSGSISRTANPGKASIFSTQAYGSYQSLPLTFGFTATGAKKTIDLTNDQTYRVDITNPGSDTSTFSFQISILDSMGNRINTKAAALSDPNGFSNAWKYGTTIKVAPGETVTLSGTFAGGVYSNYNTSTFDQNLDFTIVSQVEFYYANVDQEASDGYKPYGLDNGTDPLVIIDNLRVGGACSVITQSCVVGYTPTGIYDDYSSTTQNGSLYFGSVPGTGNDSVSRTTNPGKAAIFSTQAYGSYDLLTLSFGNTGTGARNTIDLTSDQTYTVDITNPSSDTSTISFQISIVDSLGNIINTKAAALSDPNGFSNAWKYGTSIQIAPGETQTLSGTFAGGVYSNYNTSSYDQNLDFTIVSQVWFYYANVDQEASDGYKPYGLDNGTDPLVIIDNLRVGACTQLVTGLFSPSVVKSNMTITPNPASSQVEVSYNDASKALIFSVTDITGKVVKSVAGNGSTANISVSDLAKGMYFVTTISDNTPVSVSKLVVE